MKIQICFGHVFPEPCRHFSRKSAVGLEGYVCAPYLHPPTRQHGTPASTGARFSYGRTGHVCLRDNAESSRALRYLSVFVVQRCRAGVAANNRRRQVSSAAHPQSLQPRRTTLPRVPGNPHSLQKHRIHYRGGKDSATSSPARSGIFGSELALEIF